MNKQEALNKIDENLFKERDEWFLSILKDLKIGKLRLDCIIWVNSNDEWMFKDYKDGDIRVSYYRIWDILGTKYKMKYFEIREYIKYQLLKHLNWKVTPLSSNIADYREFYYEYKINI
jgi:hypothetical protein